VQRGFKDWKRGGELYTSMIDQVNPAIAEFPVTSVNIESGDFSVPAP